MKSSNKKINKYIEKLSSIKDDLDLDNEKLMIQYRFLSEVERLMEEKDWNKKILAKKIKTSPSYITQLFQGSKPLNIETISKFQFAFDIKFDIIAKKVIDKNIFFNPPMEVIHSQTHVIKSKTDSSPQTTELVEVEPLIANL